jgi:triphosphatase
MPAPLPAVPALSPPSGASRDECESAWQFESEDLRPLRDRLDARENLAGFRLVRAAALELTDCYVDTPDARLARAGFALRLRNGGVHGEATLKSLRGGSDGLKRRREITQPLADAQIAALLAAPGPVAERARAVAGGEPLEPLFTAHTHRDVFQALSGDVDAAKITLDSTELSSGADVTGPALQRVEVELQSGSMGQLQPLLDELRATAGLEPARTSRFEAGLAAARRAALVAPPPLNAISPDMGAVAAGQTLLRRQLAAWRAIEPAVRLGEDPEALHQLRVTGRRLIEALRLLQESRLGGALRLRRRFQAFLRRSGPARDLDVQMTEFEAVNVSTPDRALQPLLDKLARRRKREHAALLRWLDSPRSKQLFAALDALTSAPPPRQRVPTVAAAADRVIRRRYRNARRAAQLVAPDASVTRCHELRLAAKKLRYAAEPFTALYGDPLRRFLQRLQRVQSLLGRINDAHHAIGSLESQKQRRGLPAGAVFAMGRMAEQQQARLVRGREEMSRVWRRAGGKRWRQLRRRMRELAAGPEAGDSA